MKRRLVLLTNQYPFAFGDYSFVRQEIYALAEAFDDVVIFNYSSRDSEGIARMPANVSYAGNLHEMTVPDILRASVSPRNLMRLAQVAAAEARDGELVGHLVQFMKSAVTGMRLANDPRLRRAIGTPGTQSYVYSFWGMGAALSLPWLPRTLKRISVRLHRYDLYKEQGLNGYLPFRASLFARADTIMPISEAGRTYLLDSHHSLNLDTKIVVSRLGSSDPLEKNLSSLSVGDGASSEPVNAYLVVSCSNLIAVKRVEQIMHALAGLESKAMPVRWIHFGGGPLEEELRKQATDLMRDGLTITFAGATPHDQIQKFYAENNVDLFVNVSSSEGIPVSIMEAISYNIPILATDVGGTKEIVGQELGTGMLLDPNFSDTELTTALKLMLETPPGTYHPKSAWEILYSAATNSQIAAQIVSGSASSCG